MNCYMHNTRPAVGICSICQKALCHECVGRDAPRLVCRTCAARPVVGYAYPYGYPYGYEYKSSMSIGGWPLVHLCSGVDPATMRPRIARGIVAIGNIAVGVLAVGGVSFGLFTFGGASIGLAAAFGGAALGFGLSIGGLAIGSIAIGGAAIGFVHAIGGGAFGPSVISGMRCDETAREFFRHWLAVVPRTCR